MKTTFATVFLLISSAVANFDIYVGGENNAGDESGAAVNYYFFEGEPDCDQAMGKRDMYRVFSGDDLTEASGVRCEPIAECEANHNPDKINLVEMNLFVGDPTKYHFTIYRERGFNMEGLDGNVYGNCIVFPGDDFQCSDGLMSVGGVRLFRCLTDVTVQNLIDTNGGFYGK